MRTLLRASVPLALVLLSVSNVDAQTVRVVANEAAVRLKPDPNSSVIAMVPAGSVLEVRSKEGFWYSVSLPAENQGIVRVGYISVTDVEAFNSASGGSVTSPTPQLQGATPSSLSPDWQARYDRALGGISSGKKKFWWGMLVSGAGLGLMTYQTYAGGFECDRFGCRSTGPSEELYAAGSYMSLGGAVLSTWGGLQWAFASGDKAQLELERLGNRPSTLRIPITKGGEATNAALVVDFGRRTQASLQLAW